MLVVKLNVEVSLQAEAGGTMLRLAHQPIMLDLRPFARDFVSGGFRALVRWSAVPRLSLEFSRSVQSSATDLVALVPGRPMREDLSTEMRPGYFPGFCLSPFSGVPPKN